MQVTVHDAAKIVEVWLTRAEKEDPSVQRELKPLYAKYKAMKYTVAVFQSGSRNLYEDTRDLLLYNRKRLAEREVLRDKQIASGYLG